MWATEQKPTCPNMSRRCETKGGSRQWSHTCFSILRKSLIRKFFGHIYGFSWKAEDLCFFICYKSAEKKRGHLKCHFITHDAKNGALKLVDEFSYYHCEMGSTWYWSFLMHDIYGQSVKMLNVKTYFVSKSQVSKYGPMPFFIEMTSACNVTSYAFFFSIV